MPIVTPNQIHLTGIFVTTAAYYASMLLLTSTCKLAPVQYYLAPL